MHSVQVVCVWGLWRGCWRCWAWPCLHACMHGHTWGAGAAVTHPAGPAFSAPSNAHPMLQKTAAMLHKSVVACMGSGLLALYVTPQNLRSAFLTRRLPWHPSWPAPPFVLQMVSGDHAAMLQMVSADQEGDDESPTAGTAESWCQLATHAAIRSFNTNTPPCY